MDDVAKQTTKTKRKREDLEQFVIGSSELRLGADEEDFLKQVVKKMTRRGGTIPSPEGSDFKHLASLLKIKSVVFSHLLSSTGDSYLEAIYVMNLTASDWARASV